MFDAKIYIQRKNRLKESLKSGVVLFLGNEESPMNYPENTDHYRQDSTFLYFFGLDFPGLAYLRLARELKPGFVLTVEPGIYFISALIDKWRGDNKFSQFINYEKAEQYRDFGGIRIEDDVLVAEKDQRVLGKPIPKTVREVEEITAKE